MVEVTLDMLQTLTLRVLDEQKDTRREMNDVRTLVLGLVDQGQRIDRRFGELRREFDELRGEFGGLRREFGGLRREVHEIKDDIELMLKAEIMGRQGNFETQVDARMDAFADRLGAIEDKLK